MKIKVHMFAFSEDKSRIREVEIPAVSKNRSVNDILDLTFRYGQNDFIPLPMPSVSVGDVIEYKDKYHMVLPVGFKELTKVQFDNLAVPTSQFAHEESWKEELENA